MPVGIRGHRTVLGLGSFSKDVSGDMCFWGARVPEPCGDRPCDEVLRDFEVTARSVATPFWDPEPTHEEE
eukprot:3179716-Pyramimonas_sp.AAC.1